MNLQEHIGKYLLLKQAERQGNYELFVASKTDDPQQQDLSLEQLVEHVQLIEILSTLRDGERLESEDLDKLLKQHAQEEEIATALGWIPIDDIPLSDRLATQLQPLFYRPYTEGISLKLLLEAMRQKNRRFPLPQALHITRFVMTSAYQLASIWPEGIHHLMEISHVSYQGKLTINTPHLNSKLMGKNKQNSTSQTGQSSLPSIATLVTALTSDIHLTGPSTGHGEIALKRSINERFQGPPPLKEILIKMIESLLHFSEEECLSSEHSLGEDDASSKDIVVNSDPSLTVFLKDLMEEFGQAIDQSSLDCPPTLIETFLTSVYPFESAQAKRELIKLKQRSVEAFFPSQSRLRINSVEEFLEEDEHTQTTLTIIPKMAPAIQMYDALSTDSENGSDDGLSLDIDPNDLILNHSLDTHDTTEQESSSEPPSSAPLDFPSEPPQEPVSSNDLGIENDPSSASPAVATELEDSNVAESLQPTNPARGLLPPRPSDILSLEAQNRRDRGRQLNTLDLLGPVDDFDSIDITGAQAEVLNALHSSTDESINHEDPSPENKKEAPEDVNSKPANFAGSFKYPEGYTPTPNKVSSARHNDIKSSPDVSRQEFHRPLPVQSKRSSPFLAAAILAILTALGSNYLAQYYSEIEPGSHRKTIPSSDTLTAEQPKLTAKASKQTPTEHLLEHASTTVSKDKVSTQHTQADIWRSVKPQVSRYTVAHNIQGYDRIEDLSTLDLKPTDLIHLSAAGYLPLSIPYSELMIDGKDESPIELLKGSIPQLKLNLNLSPKSPKIQVRFNGLLQESYDNLSLPLGLMSEIEVTRPQYQSHIIVIKPTLKSLARQSIFLKSIKHAKAQVTLRSSNGSALLMKRDLHLELGDPLKLERGLSRLTYSSNSFLEFSVKSNGQAGDIWHFKPTPKTTPDAYTIRLETQPVGQGELSFRGGRTIKLSIQPTSSSDLVNSHQEEGQEERLINKKIKLNTGSYRVFLYDQKTDKRQSFTVIVYKGQRSEWVIKKEKPIDHNDSEWSVHFVRFRSLR